MTQTWRSGRARSTQHCGLATPLLNLTIPGSGNTITLTLGKATVG